MNFWGVVRKNSLTESIKSLAVILLLLSYLVGTSSVEVFHQLFHNHERLTTHSPEQEKDPCHRSIFHHEKKGSCNHEAHILKIEKCPLFHPVTHNDHLVISSIACATIPSGSSTIAPLIVVELAASNDNLPSRAPPLV